MSTLTLTLPAGFANAPGNSMSSSHFTVPLGEIETWMNGLVGYDGAGNDNWNGTQALRGINFARGASTDIWKQEQTAGWGVVPEQRIGGAGGLSGGPPDGIAYSPVPGGSLRFYLRENARYLFVDFTIRGLDESAVGDSFTVEAWLDDAVPLGAHDVNRTGGLHGTFADFGYQLSVGSGNGAGYINEGWHFVTMKMPDLTAGATSRHVVFGASELVVQAFYR